MSDLLRRLRGALTTGVIWALGWGLGIGGLIELLYNLFPGLPLGVIDMWPQTLAIPGFLCGVGFAGVLQLAERRRGFEELSLPRFTALGAGVGILFGLFLLTVGFGGGAPLWLRATVALGIPSLLSAGSAAGTLTLARMGEDRGRLEPGHGSRDLDHP